MDIRSLHRLVQAQLAFLRFEAILGLQGKVDWADFKAARPGAGNLTLYLLTMETGLLADALPQAGHPLHPEKLSGCPPVGFP
ncbi:MAG: hypothetical protein RBT80_17065 [Candidatus Vecturithrix sp.]|nr:hypothetical protein [Candidatus Vecturithrix sp.]